MPGTVLRPVQSELGGYLVGPSDGFIGSHYNFRQGAHEVIRVSAEVGAEQVAAVERGTAEFALVLEEPLIVVCSRFGEFLPWSGGMFHWQRLARAERVLPVVETGRGAELTVTLREARSGRTRATRTLELPEQFARVLHEAILEQARFPFDPTEEGPALERLRRHYPCAGALVARASVRCSCPAES